MIRIQKITLADAKQLVELGKTTFVQSHGISASAEDIDNYVRANYTQTVFEKELADPNNIYHLLYYNDQLVGFSKVILNQPVANVTEQNITKLERIYLLEDYHGLGLGVELLNFNINLCKSKNQTGLWLFVWVENKRAIGFYEKTGFVVVGAHDFRLSPTHSNPNHQMYLAFNSVLS